MLERVYVIPGHVSFSKRATVSSWDELTGENIPEMKRTNDGLFQKKIVTLLLRISMENSRGVEQKSLEFQGVHQKFRKRHGFPGGSM